MPLLPRFLVAVPDDEDGGDHGPHAAEKVVGLGDEVQVGEQPSRQQVASMRHAMASSVQSTAALAHLAPARVIIGAFAVTSLPFGRRAGHPTQSAMSGGMKSPDEGHSTSSSCKLVLASSMSSSASPDRMVLVA